MPALYVEGNNFSQLLPPNPIGGNGDFAENRTTIGEITTAQKVSLSRILQQQKYQIIKLFQLIRGN
jgi:hypothetical protein